MTPSQPAAPSFFTNRSTQAIAQDLLGTHLLYTSHQGTLGGLIVEAEAYVGTDDTAAHAYKGRRSIMSLVQFISINYAVSFYLIS